MKKYVYTCTLNTSSKQINGMIIDDKIQINEISIRKKIDLNYSNICASNLNNKQEDLQSSCSNVTNKINNENDMTIIDITFSYIGANNGNDILYELSPLFEIDNEIIAIFKGLPFEGKIKTTITTNISPKNIDNIVLKCVNMNTRKKMIYEYFKNK